MISLKYLTVFFWLLAILHWYGVSAGLGERLGVGYFYRSSNVMLTDQILECLLRKTVPVLKAGAGIYNLANPSEAGTSQYFHFTGEAWKGKVQRLFL